MAPVMMQQLANPEVKSKDEVLLKDEPICIMPGICNSAEYSASRGV